MKYIINKIKDPERRSKLAYLLGKIKDKKIKKKFGRFGRELTQFDLLLQQCKK
ncbi:hypothetical protein IJL65_04195 [bacterium]|nr:hypothetical protein [bacterium]